VLVEEVSRGCFELLAINLFQRRDGTQTMKAKKSGLVLLAALLLAAAGCGSDASAPESPDAPVQRSVATSSDEPSPSGLPELPESYRKPLMRAFARADRAENPTMACTSVIGRAASNPAPAGTAPDPERQRVFELCYVDVGARYIEALLAQVRDKAATQEDNCARIASYVVIARGSLGTFAGNVQLDRVVLDERLLERVLPEMKASCEGQIEVLRGHRQ
jgi:hypothetical protein